MIFIGILLLLTSCAQAPKVEITKPPPVQPITEADADGISLDDEQEYQQGIEAIRVRDYVRAKSIFKHFIRKNPALSGAYVNLALIEFRQGNYREAERLSGMAIERNPDQAFAYNLRAQLHLKKGEIHKARINYLKAINVNPAYANAHYNLALLYDIYLQEIALAIEHYSIYLSLLDKEDELTREWIDHLNSTLDNG